MSLNNQPHTSGDSTSSGHKSVQSAGHHHHQTGPHSHHSHHQDQSDNTHQSSTRGRDEIESEMEREHYLDVIRAFGFYSHDMETHIDRLQHSFETLVPRKYKLSIESKLGYTMERKIDAIRACARANSNFLLNLIADHDNVFVDIGVPPVSASSESNQSNTSPELENSKNNNATQVKQYLSSESNIGSRPPSNPDEMGKLYSTLSLLARDWSVGGESIRKQVHGRIIPELMKRLPLQPKPGIRSISTFSDFVKRYKILIPGSGLCRLVFDLARIGYIVQGNEWSYMMLLTSNFLLNYCHKPNLFTIYPFVSQISNVFSAEDMVQGFQIPDVSPFVLPPDAHLRMTAGDFVSIYSSESERGKWDCVITCFFLDTARNLCDYVDTIHQCLAEGGIWINLGPLTYHWTGVSIPNLPPEEQHSLELSWTEISAIIEAAGFSFFQSSTVAAQYTSNPRSLLQRYYHCIFFTAIKSPNPTKTVGPLGPSHHVYATSSNISSQSPHFQSSTPNPSSSAPSHPIPGHTPDHDPTQEAFQHPVQPPSYPQHTHSRNNQSPRHPYPTQSRHGSYQNPNTIYQGSVSGYGSGVHRGSNPNNPPKPSNSGYPSQPQTTSYPNTNPQSSFQEPAHQHLEGDHNSPSPQNYGSSHRHHQSNSQNTANFQPNNPNTQNYSYSDYYNQ